MPDRPRNEGWLPAADWLLGRPEAERRHLGWLFLVLVTLLALLVRWYRLGDQPFWADEVITWRMCRPDVGLQFWRQIFDEIQGPLYLAAVWPLVRTASTELALRLPAALAGVLTVPLLAALGNRLFGWRTARLAALLLAVSPFHLWYSQEARGYAFLILFAVTATLVFLILCERGPRPITLVGFMLLSACAVWSNFTALFLWCGWLLTLVFLVRPAGRRQRLLWLVAMAGCLLLVLPWLLKATGILAFSRLVPGAETGVALRGETTFTPLAFPYTFFAFFYGYSFGPSLRELHDPERLAVIRTLLPYLVPAGAVAAAALLSGLLHLRRRQWALAVWIVVPLLIVTFLALRNFKPFNPRYLAVVFPWVLLLSAHGLLALPRRWSQVLSLLLLGFFLWGVAGFHFNPRYAKADLRGAAAVVAERNSAGDPIFVPVAAGVFKYYYHGQATVLENWNFAPRSNESGVAAFLDEHLGGITSCWLVLARTWRVDPQDWLPSLLAREGTFLADVELAGVRIVHWRRGPVEGLPHVP